jgi:hypothetical protein
MFEQFGESLYKAGSYVTEEVEHRRKFIVSHVDALTRKQWCKVVFSVDVDAEMTKFDCECGFFEHAGMLCAHSIKVCCFSSLCLQNRFEKNVNFLRCLERL